VLVEKDFPFLQHCVAPQGLFVLVLKSSWLVLFLPDLIEGKLQLYQQCGVIEWAHHLVLVFQLSGAQWILRSWTVVPVALLGAHP
jgi:hypothetical protein